MTRLLIVDDRQEDLYLLQVLLSSNGFEIELASNGVEALEKARQSPPDVVISDILMPVMDGFSLCRAWKEDEQLRAIPFVFYTATYTDLKDEDFALNLGAERFIVKPAEPDKFLAQLREIIESHQAGKLVASRKPIEEKGDFYREYNSTLIRKLEAKMLQLKQAHQRLAILYQASNDLAVLKPESELVRIALMATIGTDSPIQAVYYSYDDKLKQLHLMHTAGILEEDQAAYKEPEPFPLGQERGLVGIVGQTLQHLIVPDTKNEPRWISVDETISSALFVPVVYKKHLLGVIAVFSTKKEDFNEEDVLNLTTLGNNLAIAIDNTRLLEQIRKSEVKYRRLHESMTDAYASIDMEGKIQEFNRSFRDMLGYSEDELRKLSYIDLTPEKWHAFEQKIVQEQILSRGFSEIYEKEYRRKNGAVIPVELRAFRLQNDLGENEGMWAIVRDISARKRADERIERQLRRLSALHTIDVAISSSFDLRVSLNVLLEQVTNLLDVDAASVLLLHPQLNMLEYAAGRGFRGSGITHMSMRLGEDYAGRSALERRLVSIPNLKKVIGSYGEAELIAQEDFVAYYAVPLIAKGKVKGVLEIFHRSTLDPDSEWIDFLETLSGQAAIAIDNAESFDGMHRMNIELSVAYDATIEGWSRALDLRNKETEGHTHRVTEMTLRLAAAMGVSEAEFMHIRRGALLHDVGKMSIPDGILQKTEPLIDEDWEIIRQHPQSAYDMLSSVTFLRPALEIPYYHHERWDGTGYPQGLKGESIPLAARIFAVAEVWDALHSDRPYRTAWTDEQAVDYIRTQAGIFFDPHVVDVFFRVNSIS
jgi:PAS domain S-box-containing protein